MKSDQTEKERQTPSPKGWRPSLLQGLAVLALLGILAYWLSDGLAG